MDIVFEKKALETIIEHSQNSYPEECCGILFAKPDNDGNAVISVAEKLDNNTGSENKKTHYSIDPLVIYEYEKKYREKGYEAAGFYHSHPDAPAILSGEDEREMIPEMLYVIASVINGKCIEIRGWRKEIKDEGYHISNFKNFF